MSSPPRNSYVLITAARNEDQYIGACLASICSQTVLPTKWVIVSDGSTDETEKIVGSSMKDHPFIQLVRKESDPSVEGFASKVYALGMGAEVLRGTDYRFIGHLDADITLEREYYEKILDAFHRNPRLGIVGGYFFESENGVFKSHMFNSPTSVPGGIQLFRRKCYQDIGGLLPMPLGGEDWYAEIRARMQGWGVEALPDVPVFHHNPSVAKRGIIREAIRGGAMDHAMGSHPLFEFVKCTRRVKQKPYGVFASLRLYGFLKSYVTGQPRHVSEEVVSFLRNEQLARLKRAIFKKGNHWKDIQNV